MDLTADVYMSLDDIRAKAKELTGGATETERVYGAKNVYLASPFFSPEQIDRLKLVKEILEMNPTIGNIYLPMEQQNEHIHPEMTVEERMDTMEWRQATFDSDMTQVKQADITVAIANFDIESGNVRPDEGTVAEMASTFVLNHKLYIVDFLKNDEKMNLMLWGMSQGSYIWGGDEIAKLATYDFINMPFVITQKPVF